MQNTRRYFLLVLLFASVVFSTIIVVAGNKKDQPVTPVARIVPWMFPIVVAKNDGGKETAVLNGTGILISRKRGNIVTAKHVIAPLLKSSAYTAYAFRDGVRYPLEVAWEHPVGDIAVMSFRSEKKPRVLPEPLAVEAGPPAEGAKVKLFGYLSQRDRSKLRACEMVLRRFICEKGVPLTVQFARAPMDRISFRGTLEEFRDLLEYEARHPEKVAPIDDLSRGIYVTALLSENDQWKEYYGMSGGALVDQRGKLIGVFNSFTEDRTIFVAAEEIPEEFFDTPG